MRVNKNAGRKQRPLKTTRNLKYADLSQTIFSRKRLVCRFYPVKGGHNLAAKGGTREFIANCFAAGQSLRTTRRGVELGAPRRAQACGDLATEPEKGCRCTVACPQKRSPPGFRPYNVTSAADRRRFLRFFRFDNFSSDCQLENDGEP